MLLPKNECLKKNRGKRNPPAHDDKNLFLLLLLCFFKNKGGGRRKRIFFWSKNQKRREKLDWKIQFDQIVFTLSLSVYTETAAVHARVHARTKKKKNTFFVVVVDFILT